MEEQPMTEQERIALSGELEQWHAKRPDAELIDGPAIFNPGVVVFLDGKFHNVAGDVAGAWDFLAPYLGALLSFAPAKHPLEAWRDRALTGRSLLVAYVDGAEQKLVGAGFLGCEESDGKSMTLAAVCSFQDLDYSDLIALTETIACIAGTDSAGLATVKETPLFAGYIEVPLGLFFAQAIPVQPIQ